MNDVAIRRGRVARAKRRLEAAGWLPLKAYLMADAARCGGTYTGAYYRCWVMRTPALAVRRLNRRVVMVKPVGNGPAAKAKA